MISEIYQVSVCLCVPFIWRSLHFSVRVFPFFSYLLCSLSGKGFLVDMFDLIEEDAGR